MKCLSAWCFGIITLLLGRSMATSCGEGFSISGSRSTNRLARRWAKSYQRSCPEAVISIQDTTSSTGVAQVCGVRRDAPAVDVASTQREMNRLEASTTNGWQYQCQFSTRKTAQINLGLQGVALATSSTGPAAACVERLGGLSLDQLRWMYSGMTEFQLIQEYDGWDESEVPTSDQISWTRMWSELHKDCEHVEISIIGKPESSPVHRFFSSKVFKARGETIDQLRFQTDETIEGIVGSLKANPNAIGFFDLQYVLSQADSSVLANLSIVPILAEKSGLYVHPSSAVFEDQTYRLKSDVFFHVNDEEKTWDNLRPFLEYAFSERGTSELMDESFWPIPKWQQMVMKTRAQTATGIVLNDIVCGEESAGAISIAGSSTVLPISQIWSIIYAMQCDVQITVEGGGSSAGAGRVCDNEDKGSKVDIGNMSREWKDKEAILHDRFIYECRAGDRTRSAIQIPVAADGLTVAVHAEGAASQCIQLLGGLTTDQLRWIFSSYDEKELVNTGWNPTSLLNKDSDPATHLWSEIDGRCEDVEIHISGPDTLSGTYSYFVETILSDYDGGETIAHNRTLPYFGSGVDEDLVRFLEDDANGISFFGYSYYYQFREKLLPIPIQNKRGEFVVPSSTSLGDGSYVPLARNIYMNILNSAETLEITENFMRFGLATRELIEITGYVPMSESLIEQSLDRLKNGPYKIGEPVDQKMKTWKVVVISGTAIIGTLVFAAALALRFSICRRWCCACVCGVDQMREQVKTQRSFRREQPPKF